MSFRTCRFYQAGEESAFHVAGRRRPKHEGCKKNAKEKGVVARAFPAKPTKL
jgi:hypothetical protein